MLILSFLYLNKRSNYKFSINNFFSSAFKKYNSKSGFTASIVKVTEFMESREMLYALVTMLNNLSNCNSSRQEEVSPVKFLPHNVLRSKSYLFVERIQRKSFLPFPLFSKKCFPTKHGACQPRLGLRPCSYALFMIYVYLFFVSYS